MALKSIPVSGGVDGGDGLDSDGAILGWCEEG